MTNYGNNAQWYRYCSKAFSSQAVFPTSSISIAQNADVGPGGFVDSRLPYFLPCVVDFRWTLARVTPVRRQSRFERKSKTPRDTLRCVTEVLALFFSSSFGSMKLVCCVSEAEEWSEVELVLT